GNDRDGKTQILDIDEEKKLITFKVVEGDLLEIYKSFIIHFQVETKGVNNLVTWTVEYEKLSPDVPDPDAFLDMYTTMTKDIEANHP
ncbi:kirola-like protein, partial [Tanacetum coccineum]